jgi:putative addiction module component (TIGR02574 family)
VPSAGTAIQIHWRLTEPESIMPTSVEQLATQAIALSPQDRAQLADLLLASLPDDADAEVDAAWDQEIMRRVAAVESGTARLVSAADVHAEARKIYQR